MVDVFYNYSMVLWIGTKNGFQHQVMPLCICWGGRVQDLYEFMCWFDTVLNCPLKLHDPDDDQKCGRKLLGRRYGTISLPPWSQNKKDNKTWKIKIKNDKVFYHL